MAAKPHAPKNNRFGRRDERRAVVVLLLGYGRRRHGRLGRPVHRRLRYRRRGRGQDDVDGGHPGCGCVAGGGSPVCVSARGPLRVDGVGGSPAFVYEARGSFKRLYAVGKQRRCTTLECVMGGHGFLLRL